MELKSIKRACSETLILSLLKDRPMHGYEMCKEIEKRSTGYFTLKHGTLYPILHKFEKQGFIAGTWSDSEKEKPKKYYKLTKKGKNYYMENAKLWNQFLKSITFLVPEAAL